MTDCPRLYYLDDIPTPYRVGVQRHIANKWRGAFKVAYCSAAEPGRAWRFDFAGLDVEILTGWQYRPIRQVNPFSFKFNPGVLHSLAQFSPDIVVMSGYVHPTMMLAAQWCRRKSKPYAVVSETSWRSSACSGWRWHVKRLLFGKTVRSMSFGLPTGREAADYFRALGAIGVPMYNFPNTPDVTPIIAEANRIRTGDGATRLRKQLGIAKHSKIILFVGRLIQAKRPMDVLVACQKIKDIADDVTIVFVGDGPLRQDIKAASTDGLSVVCLGWLTEQHEVAKFMAISAMMVLPSIHEPWGAVVNEAMAAGVPVIASDRVGAAVELIENGIDGFLFPVGDTGTLSRIIGSLLRDDRLRDTVGRAAQAKAQLRGHAYAASNLMDATRYVLDGSYGMGLSRLS